METVQYVVRATEEESAEQVKGMIEYMKWMNGWLHDCTDECMHDSMNVCMDDMNERKNECMH